MKQRFRINDNTADYIATVYEDRNKILVVKSDNVNWNCTSEIFTFDTICDFYSWLAKQDWIDSKKIKFISAFKNVKAD